MSDIDPKVVALSKLCEENMTGEAGAYVFEDKKFLEKTLPEDGPLTMEVVDEWYNHLEDLTAGFVMATGNLGLKDMKKDKKLDTVTSSMKIGRHGDISVGMVRSQEQRIPNFHDKTKAPETVTKYAQITPRIRTFAQKNKGTLKKVRLNIAEQGEKLFS